MEQAERERAVEAILFALGEPVPTARLAQALDAEEDQVLAACQALAAFYETQDRGIRLVQTPQELPQAYAMAVAEGEASFGDGSVYMEKFVHPARHIEVQVLADEAGTVVCLGERDCSVQRRHQKLIEESPSPAVSRSQRKKLMDQVTKAVKAIGYVGVGTLEFLLDRDGRFWFMEMNLRLQVEHGVTEMLTKIDLVKWQIRVAAGVPLNFRQQDVSLSGACLECRINATRPGTLTMLHVPGGPFVRFDTYLVAGTTVSPYYDSLLVKVTSWDHNFPAACRKAARAINEVRVRGVKTNIPFVTNILAHPDFVAGRCHTKFIDETPELFDIVDSRDRATRVLRYIAEIQVANPNAERHQYDTPRFPQPQAPLGPGLKQLLDEKGPKAVSQWVLEQKKLLLTDTTMRDAHQSLLATRMRTRDMVKGADGVADILRDCFSLEMWGGATFDVAYRFLHESPWERLRLLREKIPNIPFQMLLRGSNLVGYANYPDNLVRSFIKEAAERGIDVFRVFDSLNWIPSMEVAMDEVLNQNKLLEATMCYTGDILDPSKDKYTLKYYVDLAKELERRGAHMLAIKDMSGLLKPYAAKKLVSTLKQEIGIPIHLHTHDTTGNQVAALLMAAEAGVDVVDAACAPLAGLTSQPSLDALVAALQGTERDTGLDLRRVQELSNYWADVRLRYESFDHGLKTSTTDIYRYEIPGGQYTNLRPQVESLGLGDRFEEVKEMYKTVNDMLGDPVKVTPSSKVVGDLAIFMVQNDLTPENIVERGKALAFPDSVVSYFKGMMGQPAWGFPEDLQKVVLKGEEPITCRPGKLLPPVDFDRLEQEVRKFRDDPERKDLISYAMYPKVYEDFCRHRKEYGYITRMGSHVFFNGMALGETNKINIEDGKTLVIKYLGLGDHNDDGTINVQFELNGMRREVAVRDPNASEKTRQVVQADESDPRQVGASIPGMVSKIHVQPGDTVEENQVLMTIEAMKMETAVTARTAGKVREIRVKEGQAVKAKELLMLLD